MRNRPSSALLWCGALLIVSGFGLLLARMLTGETALLGVVGSIALAFLGGLLMLQWIRGRRPRE